MDTLSLKPYEEMNTEEKLLAWTRKQYNHSLVLLESPNHVLWALVNEAKRETIGTWYVNTGSVYEKPISFPQTLEDVRVPPELSRGHRVGPYEDEKIKENGDV